MKKSIFISMLIFLFISLSSYSQAKIHLYGEYVWEPNLDNSNGVKIGALFVDQVDDAMLSPFFDFNAIFGLNDYKDNYIVSMNYGLGLGLSDIGDFIITTDISSGISSLKDGMDPKYDFGCNANARIGLGYKSFVLTFTLSSILTPSKTFVLQSFGLKYIF